MSQLFTRFIHPRWLFGNSSINGIAHYYLQVYLELGRFQSLQKLFELGKLPVCAGWPIQCCTEHLRPFLSFLDPGGRSKVQQVGLQIEVGRPVTSLRPQIYISQLSEQHHVVRFSLYIRFKFCLKHVFDSS